MLLVGPTRLSSIKNGNFYSNLHPVPTEFPPVLVYSPVNFLTLAKLLAGPIHHILIQNGLFFKTANTAYIQWSLLLLNYYLCFLQAEQLSSLGPLTSDEAKMAIF